MNEKNIQTIEVTGNTVDGDSKFGALKKLIRFKYNQVNSSLTQLGIFYSGKSRVYLMFRGRDYGSTANDLYLGAYSVSKNKFTIFIDGSPIYLLYKTTLK